MSSSTLQTKNNSFTISVSFAIVSYLLLSFIIGLISVSVGWLFDILPVTVLIVLSFIPPIVFFFFHKFLSKSPYIILITLVLWFITSLTPIIELKYILVIIGLFSVLTSFVLILKLFIHSFDPHSTKIFLISFLGIDQLFKLFNQGQIPIVETGLIGKFVLVVLTVVFFLFLWDSVKIFNTNHQTFTELTRSHDSSRKILPYALLAFLLLLFLYTHVFGNMGPISYNITMFFDSAYFLGPILTLGFVFLYYYMKRDDYRNNPILSHVIKILPVILIISLLFQPWFFIEGVFFIIGLFITIVLIDFVSNHLHYGNELQIRIFMFVAITLMYIAIVLILLLELNMMLTLIAVVIALCIMLTFLYKDLAFKTTDFAVSLSKFTTKVQHGITETKSQIKSVVLIAVLIIGIIAGFYTPFLGATQPDFPETGFRAMTYNVHFGLDSYGFDNIDRVTELILREAPTIIGFQEVTFNAPLSGFKNIMDALKHNLGQFYPYSYFSEGQTGFLFNALFSVHPIVEASTITIEPRESYQRNFLNVVLDIGGLNIRVIVTHLTHIRDEPTQNRFDQAQFLFDKVNEMPSLPTILLGDFNSEPDFPETKIFTDVYQDAWNVTHPGEDGFTWSAVDPHKRIDYIFVDTSLTIASCTLIQTTVSDHLPLHCDIQF